MIKLKLEWLRKFSHHIKTFYDNTTNDGWMSFWGAVVGAAVALFVVGYQSWQQSRKDEDVRISNDQNKLKYLDFLINDTFKTVQRYDENVKKLRHSLNSNAFYIPSPSDYTNHSLDAIANKLNQEEYYLASLSELKSDSIVEFLLICNSLYETHRRSLDHFKAEFPKMIETKNKYIHSLNSLGDIVELYILKHNSSNSPVYNQIARLQNDFNQKASSMPTDILLLNSLDLYVNPLLNTLQPFSRGNEEWKLQEQARYALRDYRDCIINLSNVVNYSEINRDEMIREVNLIVRKGRPLHDYVIALKKGNK